MKLISGLAPLLVLTTLFPFPAVAGSDPVEKEIAAIVDRISLPEIPDRTYDITRFGAVGDGREDARPAIMAAIGEAAADGGGRVVLPRGTWLSEGPVHLRSKIELHLAEGAVLLFGPDPADYLPVVLTRWEGTEVMTYSPLIYARDVEDVAITGPGKIDGNAESAFHGWWEFQEDDMQALRTMGVDGTPREKRIFGEGTHLRPPALQVFGGRRILLEGYTIENSPFWVNHLVYCDEVTVRRLQVDSHRFNNDGVDLDSCRYALVEHNHFRTGDDSVVVKSGRDRDGREVGRPSEYIVVRHNDMGGEDGIALGSEMSGDIRHVYFTDNVLRKGISAIRFKANLDRGGVVEHILVRNMKVESFEKHLIWFQLNYPGLLGGGHPSTYRDLVFENITAEKAGTFFEAHAPDGAPLLDVTLRNISIEEVDQPLVLEHVEGLRFENVRIGQQVINAELDWN